MGKIDFKKFLNPESLAVALLVILVTVNSTYLFIHTMSKIDQLDVPYYEPGYQFAHFRDFLKNESQIGYITDRDITPEKNTAEFLQAQYMLAPIVLDLKNAGHSFFIIDSVDIPFIVYTMKRTNARRVVHNEYGQALFKKKP